MTAGSLTAAEQAALKADFRRDGYAVARGFLSEAAVADVNRHIDALIDRLPELDERTAFYEVPGDPETIMRLQNFGRYDRDLQALYESDRLVGLAADLLDDAAVPTVLQWFAKPPRVGKVTPPHQDGFYFKLEPSEALTFWIALDAVDRENGCIRYLPGSHLRGYRPHAMSNVMGFSRGVTDYGSADLAAEHAIVAAPGDLIIHHCMIVHRADPNPSDRWRRALGLVYYAGRARVTERSEAYVEELVRKWVAEGRA